MYTAINQLPRPGQQQEMPGQPVYWGVELNEANFKLGDADVNTLNTRIALHLAGLGSLVVRNAESTPPPETSETEEQEEPIVSGFTGLSAGGLAAATGGFGRRQRITPYAESSLVVPEDQKHLLPNRQRPTLNMGIDMANIARIIADRKHGMPATKALTAALDEAVRKAINKGARDKLVRKVPDPLMAGFKACSFIAAELTGFAHSLLSREDKWLGIAAAGIIYGLGMGIDAAQSKEESGSLALGSKQWSLSPFYSMPDRQLFTKGIVQELTFVTYRPK